MSRGHALSNSCLERRRQTMNLVTNIRRIALIACAFFVALAGFRSSDGFSQSAAGLEIKTLSSRSDLVSGGDALIEVKAPAGTQLNQLTLTLNGKEVTNQLNLNATTRSFRGLISGMTVGENT